jgi:catalase
VLGAGHDLVENAGVPLTLPGGEPDPGILNFSDEEVDNALEQFIQAIAKHSHFAREMDPPVV